MANYNTFVLVDCKTRNPVLVTSSARKANKTLQKGVRCEIWNNNCKITVVYHRNKKTEFRGYIAAEKEYHKQKQLKAEKRNRRFR